MNEIEFINIGYAICDIGMSAYYWSEISKLDELEIPFSKMMEYTNHDEFNMEDGYYMEQDGVFVTLNEYELKHEIMLAFNELSVGDRSKVFEEQKEAFKEIIDNNKNSNIYFEDEWLYFYERV